MKKYILDNLYWIVPTIATVGIGILTIIFSKQKKEKRDSGRSNEFKLNRSNGNTFQVFNGNIDSSKNSHADQLKIEASSKLFELASRLIKLTTEDFYPLRKDYLAELCIRYKELDEFFNSKEYLFNNKIADTIKSIKEIIHKAIRHLEIIETLKIQNMPLDHISDEVNALNELFSNRMQNELPDHRETLKDLIKH